jgi:hypothetical protein
MANPRGDNQYKNPDGKTKPKISGQISTAKKNISVQKPVKPAMVPQRPENIRGRSDIRFERDSIAQKEEMASFYREEGRYALDQANRYRANEVTISEKTKLKLNGGLASQLYAKDAVANQRSYKSLNDEIAKKSAQLAKDEKQFNEYDKYHSDLKKKAEATLTSRKAIGKMSNEQFHKTSIQASYNSEYGNSLNKRYSPDKKHIVGGGKDPAFAYKEKDVVTIMRHLEMARLDKENASKFRDEKLKQGGVKNYTQGQAGYVSRNAESLVRTVKGVAPAMRSIAKDTKELEKDPKVKANNDKFKKEMYQKGKEQIKQKSLGAWEAVDKTVKGAAKGAVIGAVIGGAGSAGLRALGAQSVPASRVYKGGAVGAALGLAVNSPLILSPPNNKDKALLAGVSLLGSATGIGTVDILRRTNPLAAAIAGATIGGAIGGYAGYKKDREEARFYASMNRKK